MCLKKIKTLCEKYPRGIIIFIILTIFAAVSIFFFCLFTPPSESVGPLIDWEPKKLDVSLSPGENYTKTISICAYEAGDVNITLNANKSMYRWIPSINSSFDVEAKETQYINVEFVTLSNANFGEYKGRIEIMHKQSLFSWDDVPRNNTGLRRCLKDVYKIDWAENASIYKSPDNKTINIIKGRVPCFRDVAKITIDEGNEKATLKINDGNVYTLIVKNGKQKIYRSVKEEIPFILTIKPREIIPKNVSILLVPQNQGKGYA